MKKFGSEPAHDSQQSLAMCSRIIFALILAFSSSLALVDVFQSGVEEKDVWKSLEEAEYKCLERYSNKEDQENYGTIFDLIPNDIITDIKCFVHCFFEEAGLMAGTQLNSTLFDDWLLLEARMERLSFGDYDSVRHCVDNVADSEDKCGKAFEYYKCLEAELV